MFQGLKSNGTIVINYLVDSNRDYAQILEERDGEGSLICRYVYGHDLISQTRDGATTYYHYDGLGSTRALTNSSEAVTDTYTYDAFGNLLDKTGASMNNYLFTGEFFDANIGFYYLRARYMNPATGRFVTMDTFAGSHRDPYSLHKYLYVRANPMNLIDPSGQEYNLTTVMVTGTIIGALSGMQIYHVTTPPDERTFSGYMTAGAWGGAIGGLLAYGSWYIWIAPSTITLTTTFSTDMIVLEEKVDLTWSNIRTILRSVSEAYKGSTRLGHALSKHLGRSFNRLTGIWGEPKGPPTTWHGQAMRHFREIFRGPGYFKKVLDPETGLQWLEKRLADGRGTAIPAR